MSIAIIKMTKEEVFKDIYEREIKGGCFDVKIDDLSLYQFIKRGVRAWIAHCHGYEIGYNLPILSKWERRKNIFWSLLQLTFILIRGREYDNFIFSFPRTEKIRDKYVEKFTDPLIDYSDIGKNYIIFEPGYRGIHRHPRLHSNKIIYADSVAWLANLIANYKLKKKDSLFLSKWEELKTSIETIFPETNLSETNHKRYVIEGYYTVKIYQFIFRHLKIKNFISPSRPSHLLLIPAAKKENAKVFELQHGVCYDLTNRTYGGHMDPMFTPDKFLAFGEVKNAEFYGIGEHDVINIGWAFRLYLNQATVKSARKEKSVLIISEGSLKDIQEKILNAIFLLAESNEDIHFCYRPHPDEEMSVQQVTQICNHPNISIDDKSENLMVVMNSFTHVIGCNSAGMYDALDMKKMVGKLSMCGLVPRYTQIEDEKYFYNISDNESFVHFINTTESEKTYRGHYTEFNKELLNHLIQDSYNT